MSTRQLQSEKSTNKDIESNVLGWQDLIKGSESEIQECHKKLRALRKSLNFFKKQVKGGVPFPLRGGYRDDLPKKSGACPENRAGE